jgi:hypothetical protein
LRALGSRLQQDSAVSYPFAIAALLGLMAVVGMALLAAGQVGRIQLPQAPPVDAELVLAAVWHALLGCILACMQWGAGAGLALWFHRNGELPLSRLMLLGFPLSLIAIAAMSYLVLALPFGGTVAGAGLIACFLPFLRRPPARAELAGLGRVMLSLIPVSVLLGCWMGLLGHGPTATLPGRPSGDLGFYAANMYSLQIQPLPFVNYANEGEVLLPFNMLLSMLGAALMRFIALDPFQFVLATGASLYVFGFGLALYAYLSLRSNIATGLSYVVLVLAAIVAMRYPYWVVESTPVIFTVPLAVSIWYCATDDRSATAVFTNTAMAIVGSALSKVTSVIALAAVSLAPLLGAPQEMAQQFRRSPLSVKIAVTAIAIIALSYAALMLYRFGPLMVAAGGIAPESYERYQWATQFQMPRRAVLPYLLRDTGTFLLAVLAFRMLPWALATALAVSLAAAFIVPSVLRINFMCAALMLALAGVDSPLLLKKSKWLAVAAFLLCLPAIVQTDFGGYPSSAVWVLCIGGMAWTVCASAPARTHAAAFFAPHFARLGIVILSLAGVLALAAVANQEIVFAAPSDYLYIPPEARDIWTVVRQQTPKRALIFTDQTGAEPFSALGGWNTYATTGQRQIYVAGWYQSPEFRQSPQLLMERLRLNESLLSGQIQPADLHYRAGPYSDYFAVVRRMRTMPANWRKVYENAAYALYRHGAAISGKGEHQKSP